MKNERSICDLIREQETNHRSFLVPYYQRGYRWQRVNVSALLNDFCEFIYSDEKVYSLQPLVVFDAKDNSYHVVDGQQRLTTISILLGYLGLKQISISYESRKGQQKNAYVNDCNNIDQYHVNQAYLTIKEWFETHDDEKNNFIQLLNENLNKQVKFIWYCTKDNEVATFIRLNKNKISLTNAELIKALLLKKGNFSGDSMLKQKSMAVEWSRIENTLNDDTFWGFVRPVTDNRETRMDFIFEIIKDENLLSYRSKEEIGNDHYATFRFFYQFFKDSKASAVDETWDKVNEIYNILVHWYNEIEFYHYIGFLVINDPNCIKELINKWLEPKTTIVSFKKSLKDKINGVIEKYKNLSKQYTKKDIKDCKPILLLFNIQRIIILNRNLNKDSEMQLFNKFPFYLYKLEHWNVEHIASNTENDLSSVKTEKEWLKTFLLDASISEKDKIKIKNFIKEENPEKVIFDDIYKDLICQYGKSITKEERLNDEERNQIWNFCLLDEHTNKSYGNSIFPVKRRIIIGKEMGKKYQLDDNLNVITKSNVVAFVPGCTKDLFVQAYTARDTSNREWLKTDAEAYKQEMYDCLKDEFDVLF